MKLSTLSKKLSSKRWRSKGSKGPLTLTSISLAGSCFEDERRRIQKSAQQYTIGGSLTSSLASMYSSELELCSSVGGSHGSGSTTSRSSSMITTSSVSSADSTDSTPSWSEAYMPYLDEDADDEDDLQSANERTLFMRKNSLAATRPVAV